MAHSIALIAKKKHMTIGNVCRYAILVTMHDRIQLTARIKDVLWRNRRDNRRDRYEGDWVDRAADVARETVSSLRDKARELKDDWTESMHLNDDRRENRWNDNKSCSWSQEYEQSKGKGRELFADMKNRYRDESNDWMDGTSRQRYNRDDWSSKARDQSNDWMDRGREKFERTKDDWKERGQEWIGNGGNARDWNSNGRYARNRNQDNDWMDAAHSTRDEFDQRKDGMMERTRAQARDWSNQAQNAERRMEDKVGDLRDRALRTTEEVGDRVSNVASDLTENIRDKGERLRERFQDNQYRQSRSNLAEKSPQEIKQTLHDRVPEVEKKQYS